MISKLEATDRQALAKPLAWVLRDTYGDFRKMCRILWNAKFVFLNSRLRILSQT